MGTKFKVGDVIYNKLCKKDLYVIKQIYFSNIYNCTIYKLYWFNEKFLCDFAEVHINKNFELHSKAFNILYGEVNE